MLNVYIYVYVCIYVYTSRGYMLKRGEGPLEWLPEHRVSCCRDSMERRTLVV